MIGRATQRNLQHRHPVYEIVEHIRWWNVCKSLTGRCRWIELPQPSNDECRHLLPEHRIMWTVKRVIRRTTEGDLQFSQTIDEFVKDICRRHIVEPLRRRSRRVEVSRSS